MAGKKGPQQPIDRPLSRAYLRAFSGWSTAYPPGMSEPTSLRLMENCVITPDESVAVRPALRSIFPANTFLDGMPGVVHAVGSFEPFYLNDGRKALLFAVRETIATVEYVGFRIAVYDTGAAQYTIIDMDDATWGFDLDGATYTDFAFSAATTYVRYVQIDNKVFALSNAGEEMRMFWVGETKKVTKIQAITEPDYTTTDKLDVILPVLSWITPGSQTTKPTAETLTASTLISSTPADNQYNFAYFYTFNNEIGESAPSMVTVVKTQRGLSAWNADLSDDTKSTDQLVAIMPNLVWSNAEAQGATSWNLYMLAWSDQDSVPVEGVLIKNTPIGTTYDGSGWAAHTPLVEGLESTMALPNAGNRVNYSEPSKAAQGLVAGDRLILVNDRTDAAVIRWSSNLQGDYTNFSSSKGGGYKTLTSGNLFVPATVKLWQNPQSVDTITILCMGTDGYSTSYYMQPASVSGASQNLTIMGFEETTATPGTTSPYGCEVLNNALFHPLDWELMKSTASNYNINHKPMTDVIKNKWIELVDKHNIVSSQLGTSLYYIVNNPDGVEVPEGCMGNEIWVCDTATDGTWSRWLVPAVSMHRVELDDKLYMGVVKPDGIYIFDDLIVQDRLNVGGVTTAVPIPWKFETNTQGANRAHDAWSFLKQVGVTFGNFSGKVKWGIRGKDSNGKWVDRTKEFHDLSTLDLAARPAPWDQDDHLQVGRNMMQWFFYAESLPDEPSYGQVSLVQYRYTPVSVNVGYEYGSVETFEYERATTNWAERLSDNGIPQPYMDTSRP